MGVLFQYDTEILDIAFFRYGSEIMTTFLPGSNNGGGGGRLCFPVSILKKPALPSGGRFQGVY